MVSIKQATNTQIVKIGFKFIDYSIHWAEKTN